MCYDKYRIQNLKGGETVSLLEPIAVSSETFAIDADNKIVDNAEIDTENSVVTKSGKVVKDAKIIMDGDVFGSVQPFPCKSRICRACPRACGKAQSGKPRYGRGGSPG